MKTYITFTKTLRPSFPSYLQPLYARRTFMMTTRLSKDPRRFAPLGAGADKVVDTLPRLKGIVFDVDGTLWWVWVAAHSFSETCRKLRLWRGCDQAVESAMVYLKSVTLRKWLVPWQLFDLSQLVLGTSYKRWKCMPLYCGDKCFTVTVESLHMLFLDGLTPSYEDRHA